MTNEMFSEEKLSQAGPKTTKYWYFLTQTQRAIWNMKKLLLSFKTSVLTLSRITVSAVKQPLSDITQFFDGQVQCPVLIFRITTTFKQNKRIFIMLMPRTNQK